jgi:hypothetical protein
MSARRAPGLTLLAVAASAATVAACGSSSSSTAKPAYCSTVTALKKFFINPPTIAVGASQLEAGLAKNVNSQVTAAVSSAKSDFPQQTQAMSSSLAELEKTLKGIPASGPSASQFSTLLAQLPDALNAIGAFINATHSKCGIAALG